MLVLCSYFYENPCRIRIVSAVFLADLPSYGVRVVFNIVVLLMNEQCLLFRAVEVEEPSIGGFYKRKYKEVRK